MVVVDRSGAEVQRVEGWGTVTQDRARFRAILSSYLTGDNGATQNPVPSIGTSDTTVGHVTPMANAIVVAPASQRDLVFVGDLEKAVEYSLTREVAMQPVLDQQKLKALVYYIEVLLNYLPGIRDPVRKFLVSLRDWPVQMGYSSLPHTLYKKKVEELLELHRPFSATPMEWQGCKGSSPQYRGYPCSLWTLFHALSVNAAAKDPAFVYGGVSSVANSMIGYVSQYFSCRECALHFAK
jgi:thiol oxidase